MSGTYSIAPTPTNRLLTALNIAIDEARLVRSILKSKDKKHKLSIEYPLSDKLADLDREIQYLEEKLIQLRSMKETAF